MKPEPPRCRLRRPIILGVFVGFTIAVILGCRAPATGGSNVQFTDWGGYLEFIARHREQDQESKVGAGEQSSKETIFEERLQLETEGFVYHPNFMEFWLAGLFGLVQSDFEDVFGGRRRTSSDDGDILEFDLRGSFLKKKMYPGTAFARRYRALQARPFQSSLEVTTTSYGLLWQYVDPKMPTYLQYTYTDVRLDPIASTEDSSRQTDEVFRFDTEYHFNDHNILSFVFNRDSLEESQFDLDFDTDEITVSHRLDFGQNYQHRLDSEFVYFDQSGTFDIRRHRWREVLRLEHTDTLRSWYQLEVQDRTQGNLAGVPPINEESVLLAGTLEHELYNSLVTQLYGFAQSQDFDSGPEIDRWGTQATFNYRKTNPLGVLLANYRARWQKEDRQGGELDVAITDLRQTFRDPEPIVLSQDNILVNTIMITSEDRLTLYRQGLDYRIDEFPNRVEISRVPTGRIADGETVLIDYVFIIGSNYTLQTRGHDFGIRQNLFFGLSPYYRFRWQNQDVSPREATGVTPEDITAHIAGFEFDRFSFHARVEYEDHDSNINPFRAWRLSADYSHRFKWNATGTIKARWSEVDQDAPNERTTRFFAVEGRYRQMVTEHLTLEGVALYRTEDDSITGDDEGLDLDFALEWSIRQTDVRIIYEYSEYESAFSRNDTQALFVQVRRSF